MKAKVVITLKPGVLDPQGQAIEGALHSLGFDGASDVRQGKFIELDVAASDEAEARRLVRSMCDALLANPVIEDYRIDLAAE